MKDLCNKSNEDVIKYLKSVDFVSEAQEFRIASIDGLVSFPVGCFYRSCKGSSNKIKIYDCKTEELLQACKNCILRSSKCVVTCSICDEEGDICEECSSVGYESTETLRRKCRLCQLDACVCTKSPGSLTLKLLRELTCRPFRSITRKYLFHILHTF